MDDNGINIHANKMIDAWASPVKIFAQIAPTELQEYFTGFDLSLRNDWGYLQRVMELLEEAFYVLEAVIPM